jgi:hypothetical protein
MRKKVNIGVCILPDEIYVDLDDPEMELWAIQELLRRAPVIKHLKRPSKWVREEVEKNKKAMKD